MLGIEGCACVVNVCSTWRASMCVVLTSSCGGCARCQLLKLGNYPCWLDSICALFLG